MSKKLWMGDDNIDPDQILQSVVSESGSTLFAQAKSKDSKLIFLLFSP